MQNRPQKKVHDKKIKNISYLHTPSNVNMPTESHVKQILKQKMVTEKYSANINDCFEDFLERWRPVIAELDIFKYSNIIPIMVNVITFRRLLEMV